MVSLLIIINIILLIIICMLCLKIHYMHKSADEIIKGFSKSLTEDTNILIDISSHDLYIRRLAAKLNDLLRQLRKERHRYWQGDMELKEAVANISHDIRTSLTAICGYLDLLEGEEKSETVERYLSQIENRTDVLKNLTEELFRYSVVTSLQELKPEKVDLVCILEESLLSFYGSMCEKGIKPQIDLPQKKIYRQLDKKALNRIFSNIISNALKYSKGDFEVTMKADCEIIFLNTAKELDVLTVGKLFDRFYTVESNRNSTGLGLSIAKQLTERMGGTINAKYQNEKLIISVFFE